MIAKQIIVTSLSNHIEDRSAAEHINRTVSESIGATAFNGKEQERIIKAFEDEIASCHESIRKNLKIEIEEIEIEE
ncbi:hypothetical protein [Pasteurella sp. PK-2025]|uniref:hypothetical protein n=1 Tax=Pasteurella sp. PK-2025 TaxID=3413133 RepID=UPI003C78ABA6